MVKQTFNWQPLNLKDEPDEILCDKCKQPKQALKLNENIVFWVHRGESLKACHDLDYKTSFLPYLAADLKAKQEALTRNLK